MKLIGLGTVIMAGVVGLVVAYAVALLYFSWPIDELSLNKSGVFGDSFGLLTALFSGLAFGGLILTILLQREDLQLQREELRLTREEMKSQNFENTFFQMLRLHNEIVNAIDLRGSAQSGSKLTTGRDCFLAFMTRFQRSLNSVVKDGGDPTELKSIADAYDRFWNGNQQELGHYFRYLYRIFRFIDESDTKKKRLYTGIVRAQLSDQELLILYYNCLSRLGSEKFKPLAEKYALFDNLPMSMLVDQSHASFYQPEAWGGQSDQL